MSTSDPVPSLAPEVGPAGIGRIVGEEVIGVHRALRGLFRQLQKTPPRQRQPTVRKAKPRPTWDFNKKFATISRVQVEYCARVVCPTA